MFQYDFFSLKLETLCVPDLLVSFLLFLFLSPSVLFHLKVIISSGHNKDARVRLVNPNTHGRGTTRSVSIARRSIFYFLKIKTELLAHRISVSSVPN